MIFSTGKSNLVMLSDCLKLGVGNAFETTKQVMSLYSKYGAAYKEIQDIARKHLENEAASENVMEKIRAASAEISEDEGRIAISLQYRLHAETLSVILNSCFALESYINSLGFFLLRERDIIGLVRNSSASAVDSF